MTTPKNPDNRLPDSEALDNEIDKETVDSLAEMLGEITKRMLLDSNWAPTSIYAMEAGAPPHRPLDDPFLEMIAEGYILEEIERLRFDGETEAEG